jgi:hypothetical protein
VSLVSASAGIRSRTVSSTRSFILTPTKGTDLSVHDQAHLDAVARELNGRPQQTLGWMKPSEALAGIVAMTLETAILRR